MKNAIIGILASGLISSAAFGNTFCDLRIELEGKIAAAKLWKVRANAVQVLAVENGAWSEAMAENSGSATITVALKGKRDENGEPVIKSIFVTAKQIGATEDCKILSAQEAR